MTKKDDPSIDQELLLSHEYDGIREYDNPMPRWWVWIFWGTFYFSLGYVIHFHITEKGASVEDDYQASLAEAREREAARALGSEVTEGSLVALMGSADIVADAALLFALRCADCHGKKAEGLIGPNLTDDYWLNGDASLLSIYHLINEGVPAKGMPAWNRQLRPIEVSKLAAYVGTLRGTNVPGPKGQEGSLVSIPAGTSNQATPPSNATTQ